MMKRIFMACAMLIVYYYSAAQNTISGKITGADMLPLPGATVFLPEVNKGCVANQDGYYELLNLPAGKIKIQFSFVGYTNRIETVQFSGKPLELNMVLEPSVTEAEEIVISGGYNSTQHENAVKIDVLRIDILQLQPVPGFAEMLRNVAGVDMISKGSGVAKPVIRGLSMNDILVLNNGVRFENYQYSEHHPLGIDEFGIEDVEVIKGPASLLYGSDAIGGVISFIKEKPAPVHSILGDYNLQLFSNSMGMVNNFGIKGASEKFSAGIRAGHKTHADYLQGGGDFVPNTRFNEYSAKANAAFTDKHGTYKLFYDYANSRLGLAEEEAIAETGERGRNNKIWYQEFTTHMIASQNKIYLGRCKLDINAAYQNTELIHFAGEDTVELQMGLTTLTYETRLHLPSGERSEYMIGLQGFNQMNANLNNRETILLPDALSGNYSAYGLLQHEFFKKLKLQTGLRYDYRTMQTEASGSSPDSAGYRPALDKSYGSFSGSLGATMDLTKTLLLRANFAAAYRTPNLAELTSNGLHELRYETGDPGLVPENAFEADLSLHFHSRNLTMDVAGFYNLINHYIYIAPTGDTTSDGIGIYQYRQSDSRLYGGEAGLHFHPARLEWLHCETTYAQVIGMQGSGEYLPFVPAAKLNAVLRAEAEKLGFFRKAMISFSSTTAFRQNRTAPDESATPAYTLLDFSMGAGFRIQEQILSFRIAVNNIFDTRYQDHLSTLTEVDFFNPGRNISLTLKVPFGIKMKG